jgi:hypothetical protein
MLIAYRVFTILFALLVAFSGLGKIRRDPRQLIVLHDTIGIPLKYFPLLAAGELSGATGLLFGLAWYPLGVAAGAGLVLYFAGAIASHMRVRDAKGTGPAAFMLVLAAAALSLRI